MTIARQQSISVKRDKDLVAMVIHGAGTLHLSTAAAHGIARELMRIVGEIEADMTLAEKVRRGLRV